MNPHDACIGYCKICGEALYPIGYNSYYAEEHKCVRPERAIDPHNQYPANIIFAGLKHAEALIEDRHWSNDRERIIAYLKRAIWQFTPQGEDEDKFSILFSTSDLPRSEW